MKPLSQYAAHMLLLALTSATYLVPFAAAQTSSPPPSSATSPAAASATAVRRLIVSGHPDEALKQLTLLSATQPTPPEVDKLRGLALYAQNQLSDAEAAFSAALRKDPGDQEAAQMGGLTLFRLGRPALAIPLLEGARTFSPESKADPNYILALCYLDTRRYDDARHALARQYGFEPDSAPAFLLAARMLLRREYIPIAKESAMKAIQLDPQLPLAHALLGEIALAGNHIDEAIAELEKERDRNPLNGNVYDRLGDAYSRAGDFQKSQQALQRALLLEPNSTGPYILLGKVMLKRQDPVAAATYLERARAMDPSNYMTHNLLGQAYRALGRREDASREIQTAQTLQTASEPKLESLH